jgi:steroid delta-isomerase-like uncharacterized protein
MTPKETVIDYWRAWSEHKIAEMIALLAPDFTSRSSLSQGRPVGKDLLVIGFKMFDKALPDLKEEVITIIAEGNNVSCQVIETATFTHAMELPVGVIQPTNRSYKLPVGAFFRVNGQGLITEQRTYWDTAEWERQIGIDSTLFAPKLN